MFYRSYTPGPPLGDFIGRFWLCSDTPSHPRERILPSGTMELVFNLCDDEIRIYNYAHHESLERSSLARTAASSSSIRSSTPQSSACISGRVERFHSWAYRPANWPTRTSTSQISGGHWPASCVSNSAPPRLRSDSRYSKRRSSHASITRPSATTQYRLRSTRSSKGTRPSESATSSSTLASASGASSRCSRQRSA